MRVLRVIVLMLLLGGCSSLNPLPVNATLDDSRYYVALSVRTGNIQTGDRTWRPGAISMASGKTSGSFISVTGYPEGTILIYEVPDSVFEFHDIVIYETTEGAETLRPYRTVQEARTISLQPGVITYLGRLEVTNVMYGNERGRLSNEPAGISFRISDQGDSDTASIVESYGAIRADDIRRDVRADWSGSVALARYRPGVPAGDMVDESMPELDETGPRSGSQLGLGP